MDIDEIIGNFELLDEWDDRYRYLIELGRTLEPLPKEAYTEENKVRGCASQVWLDTQTGSGPSGEKVIIYRGDSDAHIVKGLVASGARALFGPHAADDRRDRPAAGLRQARPLTASDAAALQRPARHGRPHQE